MPQRSPTMEVVGTGFSAIARRVRLITQHADRGGGQRGGTSMRRNSVRSRCYCVLLRPGHSLSIKYSSLTVSRRNEEGSVKEDTKRTDGQ
ncbi:hypothetical protein PUN28_018810 [Cardiocondyla obscurior]|uniref:Uncharacterized protein n=1 Tax=Cardiocondyla obscurior TaxID=286306 RepID=A0AAW2EG82_9HYME